VSPHEGPPGAGEDGKDGKDDEEEEEVEEAEEAGVAKGECLGDSSGKRGLRFINAMTSMVCIYHPEENKNPIYQNKKKKKTHTPPQQNLSVTPTHTHPPPP